MQGSREDPSHRRTTSHARPPSLKAQAHPRTRGRQSLPPPRAQESQRWENSRLARLVRFGQRPRCVARSPGCQTPFLRRITAQPEAYAAHRALAVASVRSGAASRRKRGVLDGGSPAAFCRHPTSFFATQCQTGEPFAVAWPSMARPSKSASLRNAVCCVRVQRESDFSYKYRGFQHAPPHANCRLNTSGINGQRLNAAPECYSARGPCADRHRKSLNERVLHSRRGSTLLRDWP